MSATLTDDLGALTGEELFHLITELANADRLMSKEVTRRSFLDGAPAAVIDASLELAETLTTVAGQVARITVPLKEAQGIIWRAVYARNHPVRVPGT